MISGAEFDALQALASARPRSIAISSAVHAVLMTCVPLFPRRERAANKAADAAAAAMPVEAVVDRLFTAIAAGAAVAVAP